MTISITASRAAYTGNGLLQVYDVKSGSDGIYFVNATDLTVTVDDVVQTLGTHYTVANPGTLSGQVTFLTAPASGAAIVIERNTPITQELALTAGGSFSPSNVMAQLDKQIRIDQDIDRRVDDLEATVADIEETVANLTAPIPSYFTLLDSVEIAFNGITTIFPLTADDVAYTPISVYQVMVFFNGVWQEPGVSYTIAGSSITFTFPPESGDQCHMVGLVYDGREFPGGGTGPGGGGEGGGGGGTGITLEQVIAGLYSSGLRPVEIVDALPTEDNVEGRLAYYDGEIYVYRNGEWSLLKDYLAPDTPTGVEVFDADPTTGNYEGRVIFNTTDNQLKKFISGVWIQVVEPITAAEEVADGSITTAKFASGIRPVEIVGTLPTTDNFDGRLAYLTTDEKLYRHNGSIWKTGIDAADLTGSIIAGQLADGSVGALKLQANSVIAGKIAAGAVSADEIAANAITTAKLAAGAITAAKIAALAISAEHIAAGTITGDRIAANTLTAGLIQAGAIGASQISAGAITSDKLAANSVTAAAIQAGIISADKIAAGAVTAAKIAAGAIDGTTITGATVRTSSGSTRVEMDTSTNALNCYVSGSNVAKFGSTAASGLVYVLGAFTSTYPAYFENTSAAGGALRVLSVGGYAAEINNTSSASGAYGATIRNTSGGFGAIGASSGSGGYAFNAISGGYAPFTGCHNGFALKSETIEVGDIVVDGDLVELEIMDTITKVHRCTTVGEPAIGVYTNRFPLHDDDIPPSMRQDDLETPKASWAPLKPDYDVVVFNSIGEGGINVCGRGGNIAKGDLIITSDLVGKGQRQADDVVRARTVARARQSVTFATPDEVKMIACVYICG